MSLLRRALAWLRSVLGAGNDAPGQSGSLAGSTRATFVDARPELGLLRHQLAEQAANAAAKGKRPFVYVCAAFLPPSIAITESLQHPLMREAFEGTWIIRVDLGHWGRRETEELERNSGIPLNRCPVFFELDSSGVPTGRQIDGSVWGEDIPKNMAPPLKQFFRGARA